MLNIVMANKQNVSIVPVRNVSQSTNTLLGTYPRTRPELTPAHQAVYVEEYRSNRLGRHGLSRVVAGLERWMHQAILSDRCGERLLELGAGTLNHIPFEPNVAEYDVIEPFHQLWEDSPGRDRVGHFYDDVTEVPEYQRYDRILSVAVLEHLVDLPLVVARCGLLLAEDGRFEAGFPSEGGFLWGAAWRCTTGISYRFRTGLDYATVIRHEHINTAFEIVAVLQHFFEVVRLERFPLSSRHLSFYSAAHASRPRRYRCLEFCDTRQACVERRPHVVLKH